MLSPILSYSLQQCYQKKETNSTLANCIIFSVIAEGIGNHCRSGFGKPDFIQLIIINSYANYIKVIYVHPYFFEIYILDFLDHKSFHLDKLLY